MSNLFSRPKMPNVYTPPYVPTQNAQTTTSAKDNDDTTPKTDDDERINQIMSRHRGRSGTIGTSYRGVLNETGNDFAANNQTMLTRKTLLGD